jgi:protein TonB
MLKNINKEVIANSGLIPGQYQIRVYFKVNKVGKVVDVNVKSPSSMIEKEVFRVLNTLPACKPGSVHGKPVDVPYSLPLMINL